VKTTAQIFLSYAREDKEKVEKLHQQLSDAGFKPWMATKDILPGERWESGIRGAIRRSDFFLACLSANSVSKRGWIQKEIRNALDIWQEKLEDDIYLIPVRLEDCEAPESLGGFQWVNLFEEDGWTRLVKAIQVGMKRRVEIAQPIVQESAPFEPYPVHEKPSPSTETATPLDWMQIVQVIVAVLSIVPPSVELYKIIRGWLSRASSRNIQQALTQLEPGTAAGRNKLTHLLIQTAQNDPEFADTLSSLFNDTQNVLMGCLLNQFTNRDLREVYARLGIGFDDLVAGTLAGKADKVNALIEHLKMDGRIPELVAAMWKVRPSLRC
jgi:hypothetical protein